MRTVIGLFRDAANAFHLDSSTRAITNYNKHLHARKRLLYYHDQHRIYFFFFIVLVISLTKKTRYAH